MSFSNFAKLLFPYISNNQSHSEFIIHLIAQIMEAPYTKEDEQLDIEGQYNPLSKLKESTLNKIYDGTRFISNKSARTIMTHLDKDKFATFLTGFPEDVQKHIESDLQKNEIVIENTQALADTCANLFESILLELTQKQRAKHKIQDMNEGAQLSIPEECKVCLYCHNWEGNALNVRKSTDGVYGPCIKYDSKIMSSSKEACKDFKPNYNRISNHILCKNRNNLLL